MADRWVEHPIRPGGTGTPASSVLAGLVVVVAVVSAVTPLLGWLAAGAAPSYAFQLWRPLLYGLTSGSLLQAVINAVFLVLVGRALEPGFGSWQFASLYVLSGLGGAAALCLVGVPADVQGSMCGVFGILAAAAVVKHFRREDVRSDIVLISLFIIWSIVVGSAAWVADLGAVAVGVAVGLVQARIPLADRRRAVIGHVGVALVCLVAIVATWLR
ncbi:rhomboid family intramembrane serine protease [Acidipropionibacterium timonense]|uniref:rhomboid family intramembrane serine protease n=1 Tax=Acidipropionibacterium timonense TaxID=2161818 RepID=UPI0010304004|nr:rhomboid family intramembrane serine protease [Acidipropionibacterium timonense]